MLLCVAVKICGLVHLIDADFIFNTTIHDSNKFGPTIIIMCAPNMRTKAQSGSVLNCSEATVGRHEHSIKM